MYMPRRTIAPLEESAWIDDIDPSLPCDMARSMSTTSTPRILTDDDPVGVLAQRRSHTVGQGRFASTFDVGAAPFPHDLIGVEVREPVEADLEAVLDRDHAFLGRDLVEQATQHRRLSGVRATGHDQVELRLDRSRKERCQPFVDHAEVDHVLQSVDREVVAADGDRRSTGQTHHGVESFSSGSWRWSSHDTWSHRFSLRPARRAADASMVSISSRSESAAGSPRTLVPSR